MAFIIDDVAIEAAAEAAAEVVKEVACELSEEMASEVLETQTVDFHTNILDENYLSDSFSSLENSVTDVTTHEVFAHSESPHESSFSPSDFFQEIERGRNCIRIKNLDEPEKVPEVTLQTSNFSPEDFNIEEIEYQVSDSFDEISKASDSSNSLHQHDFSPTEFISTGEESVTNYQTEEINATNPNLEEIQQIPQEPQKIKTIRDDLEGQIHPETGVPYERKIVVTDNGTQVEGVFPQFDSTFDVQLPEGMEQASDKIQFDECNRQLKAYCENNEEFRSQFNERQQDEIAGGRTPYGYTWHHNEVYGKMQLVNSDVHFDTRHTGGRSIWGGGTENR